MLREHDDNDFEGWAVDGQSKMMKRPFRARTAGVFVWACAVSVIFAVAADGSIGANNIAYVLLDGAVMFVVAGVVPGVVYIMFKHRIENTAGLYGIWAMIVAFIGLGNFVAWIYQ